MELKNASESTVVVIILESRYLSTCYHVRV